MEYFAMYPKLYGHVKRDFQDLAALRNKYTEGK